jgi:dTDP-4-amino-4,6-dideoxygalactose transaminase
LYVVRVPAERRQGFQESLRAFGIETGIHYPIALPNLAAYRHLGHRQSDFPSASKASQEIVSLPMFPELTVGQIQHVADRVRQFAAANEFGHITS